jgi:hypothetical protein
VSQARLGRDHDRARSLAAGRIDGPLEASDARWLDTHLAGCDACATVAAGYEADRLALRGLRAESFEPPRDLWARTAAVIEADGGSRDRTRGRRFLGLPAAVFAPVAGLAAVAVVVGAGLFNGQPLAPDATPGATPIAFAAGNVAVLNRAADGSLALTTGRLHEVCPMTADACRVEPSFETAPVAGIRQTQDVDAVISPARDRLVVIPRGAGGTGGVYVVPVKTPTPDTTPAATRAPGTASATEAPTEPPTEAPTQSSEVATGSPVTTDSPPATEAPTETESPASTETPSDETPSDEPVSPEPTATTAPTDPPSATPEVAVTPRPDGALEIASGVLVVDGQATYSPNGKRFAFTARPSDGSAGPDVYVWNTDEAVARRITDDHRSVFADWDRDTVLVSRVAAGEPSTVRLDPATGETIGQPVRGAWLPTLAPDRSQAVWWDGGVKLAADGLTWTPAEGRLVTGAWPDAGTSARPITNRRVDAWQVRWDPSGAAVAVWVAGRNPDAGRLSLYRVDETSGKPDLARPMLDAEPALGDFTLEPGMLAWSAPGKDSGKTVQVLAWKGETIGRAELPADGDATLVQ